MNMESPEKAAAEEPGAARRPTLANTYIGAYVQMTRQPVYSLLFLVPLLIVYEAYAYFLNFNKPYQIRNGADILVKTFFHFFGVDNLFSMMMAMLLAILVVVGISFRRMRQPLIFSYFPLMLLESLAYAFLLGPVTQRLTGFVRHPFLGPDVPAQDMSLKVLVSLGAGVYEELVFRVFLISALLYIFEKVAGFTPSNAVLTSILLSSLIFSSFHYLGAYRWQFTLESFLYRAIAGLVLSGLYIARGLGITAWTHSLYDIYVLIEAGP
ncbi:MAG: CPBP family intramembrane metalloprotease [Candidatus Wallbacteria bacterium]|nr:CPBP family intramembrane metalloprotease [Candidatus Wallbacteria bacterium]